MPHPGRFREPVAPAHPDNAHLDYRFVQQGTGFGCSDANLEIRWFMNRQFRLALLRDWEKSSPETVIDFTRYDLLATNRRIWAATGACWGASIKSKPVRKTTLRPDGLAGRRPCLDPVNTAELGA